MALIGLTRPLDSGERAPGQILVDEFPDTGTFEARCHIHPKRKLVVHVN